MLYSRTSHPLEESLKKHQITEVKGKFCRTNDAFIIPRNALGLFLELQLIQGACNTLVRCCVEPTLPKEMRPATDR